MALDLNAILTPVISHALAIGYFESVNGHEPASAPGLGLTAAVWVDRVAPASGASALNATTVLVVLNIRIYAPAATEPMDLIDPNMTNALSALFGAYSGDFDLGGQVRNVDLLGQFSPAGLNARAGYMEQDNILYRVYTIALPLVVNDVWTQSA